MRQLIVGLGNPGGRYHGTRHNIGFAVVDTWANQVGAKWRDAPAWNAEIAEVSQDVWLIKPTTFMNDSGRTVAALAHYFKLNHTQVCVIVDDRDLPFGTLRWRGGIQTGAHHNGLGSVLKEFGSVKRLRIGIANDLMRHIPLKDFVLDHFTGEEQEALPEILETAVALLKEKYAPNHT